MTEPTCAEGMLVYVNGEPRQVVSPPVERLSRVLREELRLVGTKVGCDAGDCGACTVLLDDLPVCACLVAVGQIRGRSVTTIEGLACPGAVCSDSFLRLQREFLRHGAAQCGICTPGMLVSATALLETKAPLTEQSVADALGGVLCRCTGYRKILAAVLAAGAAEAPVEAASQPSTGNQRAVGKRLERLDGLAKVSGKDIFGADVYPADALLLRVIRSPHDRAGFRFGDLSQYLAARPGVEHIFTAADVPGRNRYGVLPPFADQPVFAERETRFQGEAVAAVVGRAQAIRALRLEEFPVAWESLSALTTIDQALAPDAPLLHAHREANVLVRGQVACGDVDAAISVADVVVESEFETGFVEHAYIEPEAGFARRIGDRMEIQACTQSPYMDRADVAAILGIEEAQVRILPTAVGGGFGSKLDLSVQPFLAVAAWLSGVPVRMEYSRTESIRTTTKRHPSRIKMRAGATSDGKLTGVELIADFNTGAYASWGPTVANRVPVHASGPYLVPNYRARTRAVHTHLVPAGAFRGFGVPQATASQEQLYDELAERLGMDALDFRLLNALGEDDATVTGQRLGKSTGIRPCLEALKPKWAEAKKLARGENENGQGRIRHGVGIAAMWYGCGNTGLPNPSTIRIGLKPDGRIALHQGAVDIGQGSNTVVTQICADSLGCPVDRIDLLSADTDQTPDGGKTSASRQTFVSGNAARMAALQLRARILQLAGGCECGEIVFLDGRLQVVEDGATKQLDLRCLPLNSLGYVVMEQATFDPPVKPLDGNGQGSPYALYGFGAQIAEVAVDTHLGLVRVTRMTAAHDTGRTINPTLAEGQIEGGVAQGLGFALMEEFFPGRGENLHDYLIPTIGDIPQIDSIFVEVPAEVGPFGAKGLGEHTLVPTAPAILNAIYDAVGVRIRRLPATPDRVLAAIQAKRRTGGGL